MSRRKRISNKLLLVLFLVTSGIGLITVKALAAGKVFLPLIINQKIYSTPTMTPMPQGVFLLDNSTHYIDSSNYANIFGEVLNNTTSIIRLVRVVARIYDATGHEIGNDADFSYLDNFLPGDKSCIFMRFRLPVDYASFALDQPTYSSDGIQEPSMGIDQEIGFWNIPLNAYSVSGLVINQHGATVQDVEAIVTLYNHEQGVVGCGVTSTTPAVIGAGQTGSFSILFSGSFFQQAESFHVQVNSTP